MRRATSRMGSFASQKTAPRCKQGGHPQAVQRREGMYRVTRASEPLAQRGRHEARAGGPAEYLERRSRPRRMHSDGSCARTVKAGPSRFSSDAWPKLFARLEDVDDFILMPQLHGAVIDECRGDRPGGPSSMTTSSPAAYGRTTAPAVTRAERSAPRWSKGGNRLRNSAISFTGDLYENTSGQGSLADRHEIDRDLGSPRTRTAPGPDEVATTSGGRVGGHHDGVAPGPPGHGHDPRVALRVPITSPVASSPRDSSVRTASATRSAAVPFCFEG